jgi:two-component system, OmpR family, response regulator
VKVLVISGDPDSQEWLVQRLNKHGFAPFTAHSVSSVLSYNLGQNALAIMLDCGASYGDATGSVQALRNAGREQPLVVVKEQRQWQEVIQCLDAGADDFITKPVRSEEIAARLRAAIRRAAGYATPRIPLGDVELDMKTQCAWRGTTCLNLTRSEFRLLRLFSLARDQVLTHEEIHARLYPGQDDITPNAVEVLVARLRRKIGSDRIRTVRGSGYRFETKAEDN